MKARLLVGLVVTTAFAQAPDNISGLILHESSHEMGSLVVGSAVVSLRPNGTYATIVREEFLWHSVFPELPIKTTFKADEGTFTYEKTGPETATLTLTSSGEQGVVTKDLVFFSESAGIFSVPPHLYGNFEISSMRDAPIVNASARGTASASNALILGFYVSERSRHVLVRAIGPSLALFDVPEAAEDTTLELIAAAPSAPGRAVLRALNDDWEIDSYHDLEPGAYPPVTTLGAFMGAFPLQPGSKDAAFAAYLYPGAYTVVIRTKSETPAEVLAEVYVVP
jgi:hypothetical protein